MDSRPTRQTRADSANDSAASRSVGPALLGTALAAILGLGALRNAFPAIPDLAWALGIAALLIGGGMRMAAARQLDAAGISRQQLVARAAVVLAGAGLVVGILSVQEAASAWPDTARAAGALALCVAFALLPFGVALRGRVARLARVRAEAEAERRAWLATVYAPTRAVPAPSSEGTEPAGER